MNFLFHIFVSGNILELHKKKTRYNQRTQSRLLQFHFVSRSSRKIRSSIVHKELWRTCPVHMFLSVQTAVLSRSRPRKVQLPAKRMVGRFVLPMIRYSRSLSRDWLVREGRHLTTTIIGKGKFAHSNFRDGNGQWYRLSMLHPRKVIASCQHHDRLDL